MFKRLLFSVLAVAALASIALPSLAAYLEKPFRLIVPSDRGGKSDALMRVPARQISRQM